MNQKSYYKNEPTISVLQINKQTENKKSRFKDEDLRDEVEIKEIVISVSFKNKRLEI